MLLAILPEAFSTCRLSIAVDRTGSSRPPGYSVDRPTCEKREGRHCLSPWLPVARSAGGPVPW